MDTPTDDLNLGPNQDQESQQESQQENQPIEDATIIEDANDNHPLGPENTHDDQDQDPTQPDGVILPTNEQILERLNNKLKNETPKKMATETTPEKTPTETTPETKPKKDKKEKDPTTPVVIKKDYTILILSIAVLVITVGIYAWQNYRKKKEDENTIDLDQEQQDGYNPETYYQQ